MQPLWGPVADPDGQPLWQSDRVVPAPAPV